MELMVAIFLVVLVAPGNTFNPLSWLFLFDNLHSAYQLNLNGTVIELNFQGSMEDCSFAKSTKPQA